MTNATNVAKANRIRVWSGIKKLAEASLGTHMFSIITNAVEKSGARKTTHATTTAREVIAQATSDRTGCGSHRSLGPNGRARHRWLMHKYRPWSTPQITNVQSAPCHSPPIDIVINRFE